MPLPKCLFVFFVYLLYLLLNAAQRETSHSVGQKSQSLGDKLSSVGDI